MSLWSRVGESLRTEFNDIEQNVGGGHVVSVDTFKVCRSTSAIDFLLINTNQEVLRHMAGEQRSKEKSSTTKRRGWDVLRSESPTIQWLREDDINLIASRFELGNRIDVKVFFDFFQDSDEKLATGTLTCETFKFSEEWLTLRRSVKRDLVTSGRQTFPPTHFHSSIESSHLSSTDDEVTPRGTFLGFIYPQDNRSF